MGNGGKGLSLPLFRAAGRFLSGENDAPGGTLTFFFKANSVNPPPFQKTFANPPPFQKTFVNPPPTFGHGAECRQQVAQSRGFDFLFQNKFRQPAAFSKNFCQPAADVWTWRRMSAAPSVSSCDYQFRIKKEPLRSETVLFCHLFKVFCQAFFQKSRVSSPICA